MPYFAMIPEEQAIFNQTAVIMQQLMTEEDQPSLSASFFNTWHYFHVQYITSQKKDCIRYK
jgi:hypothetical protein